MLLKVVRTRKNTQQTVLKRNHCTIRFSIFNLSKRWLFYGNFAGGRYASATIYRYTPYTYKLNSPRPFIEPFLSFSLSLSLSLSLSPCVSCIKAFLSSRTQNIGVHTMSVCIYSRKRRRSCNTSSTTTTTTTMEIAGTAAGRLLSFRGIIIQQ